MKSINQYIKEAQQKLVYEETKVDKWFNKVKPDMTTIYAEANHRLFHLATSSKSDNESHIEFYQKNKEYNKLVGTDIKICSTEDFIKLAKEKYSGVMCTVHNG